MWRGNNKGVREIISATSLYTARHIKCGYLGVEHVADSFQGSVQHKSSDKEAEQHHIGEDGGEVHHLRNEKEIVINKLAMKASY